MRRPEEALHRACAELLALYAARGLLAYAHPANGGYRTRGEAGVLKALGLVAGVPDLLVWLPNGRAFQCELKAGKQPLSDPQLLWHRTMAAMGHAVYVARSVDELEAVLRSEGVPAVGQLAPRIDGKAPGKPQERDGRQEATRTNPHPPSPRPATDFRSPR